MLHLINISSSMSPEDASYIYKVLEDKVFDLLLNSIFSSVNLNIFISEFSTDALVPLPIL
jgi:hypothetical protein